MIRTGILLASLILFMGMISAQDWLEGGYVGSSDYGEIRQYFTDPIFYSSLPVSQPISMYRIYNTIPNFKQPLYLGKNTPKYSQDNFQSGPMPRRYSFSAWPSDFRNRSQAYMLSYQPPILIPKPSPISGDTPLTIKYPDSRNFNVYVDGVYVGSGSGGTFTTQVKGGMTHEITVWDGFWNYQKSIYFGPGMQKVTYVEAV